MSEKHIFKGGIGANIRPIELPCFKLPMKLQVPSQPLVAQDVQCGALVLVPSNEIVKIEADVVEAEFTIVEPSFSYIPTNSLDFLKGVLIDVSA